MFRANVHLDEVQFIHASAEGKSRMHIIALARISLLACIKNKIAAPRRHYITNNTYNSHLL